LELARSLLGCLLINKVNDDVLSGFIVETEAYRGPLDRAAHSFGNRRTKRTEIMFAQAGLVYTYTMHMHCLLNIVSAGLDEPEAVLIRAVEPFTGINAMYARRNVAVEKNLTNGPGKLTKALGIRMEDYGHPIYEPPLYIAEGYTPSDISTGPRIGIGNSGEAMDYPWRYWVTGNRYVSR
jgi:DNA-3-methyladenine glycosylase